MLTLNPIDGRLETHQEWEKFEATIERTPCTEGARCFHPQRVVPYKLAGEEVTGNPDEGGPQIEASWI